MTYAVVEIGGRQIWIQSGKFYDVNKLNACPGETVLLNKVLLLSKQSSTIIGQPCVDDYTIKAKVLKHFKSKKTLVFKMKPKKNMQSKRGFRQEMTRLLIQEI